MKPAREPVSWKGPKQGMPWGRFNRASSSKAGIGLLFFAAIAITPMYVLLLKRKNQGQNNKKKEAEE